MGLETGHVRSLTPYVHGVAMRVTLRSKEFRTFLRAKIEEDAAIIDCSADQDDLFHYTGTYGTLYCRVWGVLSVGSCK